VSAPAEPDRLRLVGVRILFWSESFWPSIGGISVLAARFLPALRARGHDVLVLTSQNDARLPQVGDFEGTAVRRFPFWSTLDGRDPTRLIELGHELLTLARTFRPDVVHLNGVRVGAFFQHSLRRGHPAPLLVTLHGMEPAHFYSPESLLDSTLRAADWVVACSSSLLEETLAIWPELGAKSSVIPNGLELPPLPPTPLPFDPALLLCLGRLEPEKGFDLALSAFGRLADRRPALRMLLAGDGPLRGQLEAQARALGLESRAEFLGWVPPDEVPRLINRATAVLMPSREDALPLVAIEAAQMARPVLAARVGGLPEVVTDGSTGLLVQPGSPRALAAAVERLLDAPELAERMGAAARRRAQEVFGLECHVESYEALYRRLASASGR
jgi:glycogen(starch) synthase